jgi:large subunit ribosomal protein L21
MTLAIIKTGGKQYKVAEGDILSIEKLEVEAGQEVIFDQVLLLASDKETKIGEPLVAGAKVKAEVVEQGLGDKVVVIQYKAKSRYKKIRGHRQPFTKVKITNV